MVMVMVMRPLMHASSPFHQNDETDVMLKSTQEEGGRE
jgi:hypothetical protein